MERKQHIQIFLVILVLTIVVGIALRANHTPQHNKATSHVAGNNSTSEVSDWTLYRNDTYNFEIRYPKNFTVQEKSSEDTLLSLKKVEDTSYSTHMTMYVQKGSTIKASDAEPTMLHGKKTHTYYFREGAGYSGVFQMQIENDVLTVVYDVIGKKDERLVQKEFETLIATIQIDTSRQ